MWGQSTALTEGYLQIGLVSLKNHPSIYVIYCFLL